MLNTHNTKTITNYLQRLVLLCSIMLCVWYAWQAGNKSDDVATHISAMNVAVNGMHSISTPKATQIPANKGNSNHYTIRKTNKAKLQIKTPADNELTTYVQGVVYYVLSSNRVSRVVVARPGYYLFLFRYTPF
jgi:outer membrane lipoprotein-sorting protein